KIGDSVAVLKDGAVQQVGKPEEIVLQPANEHIEEFVREVNKARAIHVRAIMDKGSMGETEYLVSADARCEDVLPLFASYDTLGVTDEAGKQIGKITAKQVIKALARHSQN